MSASRSAVQPAFRFSCLGPVELASANGEVVPFRTRKQAALLFLLARQPGTPLLRNHLLDLLWSGADEASARHSLSHSVSLMNKALGCEAIAPSGKDLLALADGLVWLDVTAFERHVRDGQAREARELWRGNLFEGLHVPRAPRFERWTETERQRLGRAMREVLAELVDVERAAGEWHAMRETAEALLAFDAFDEGAMLACLEASSLLGDRTHALRRFREFEVLLRTELEADPGHALRAWAQRHRRGEVTAAPEAPSPARVSETTVLPVVQPLYGRHAEFATLWEAWESARTGHGSCVLLQGPAGIGKTALSGKLWRGRPRIWALPVASVSGGSARTCPSSWRIWTCSS